MKITFFTKDTFIWTILLVSIISNLSTYGQCTFTNNDTDKTLLEVETCLSNCGCNTIEVSSDIAIAENWDLVSQGALTIEVKTGGSMFFDGSGGNAGEITLASGSSILIEDTNDNNALTAANQGNVRITIGGSTYKGNEFSDIIASGGASENGLLPVELISFKAMKENEKGIVTWVTAAELNNDFFTIQRSKDGANFEDIGTVAGMGTTNQPQTYTFTDENPLAGTSYYRLKQTDFDGTTEIFKPALFEMISSSSHITVFPNPVSGNKFKININGISNSANLKIVNLHGEEIYNQLVNNARNEELTINQVSIKPGIYIAILYTNLQLETFKFVKK